MHIRIRWSHGPRYKRLTTPTHTPTKQKDLDTPCYDTAHKLWMIAYGVPSVVIFVLGVPMAGWYLLWNKRNRLRDHVVKEKYGFLYR